MLNNLGFSKNVRPTPPTGLSFTNLWEEEKVMGSSLPHLRSLIALSQFPNV